MLKNDEVDYCTKCTVKTMCEECYAEHCQWLRELSDVTFSPEYKSKVHHIYNEPRTKTNWNAIALILNVYEYIINVNWRDIFYPTTGIDKEIEEEEKEIAELERQKEKIDKLSSLKRRKEKLFEQVDRYSE